ncbi:MAG: response regulator [Nitrospirae bacterium]|nr:MAG: response regulator [Nitrospirota bacterium]
MEPQRERAAPLALVVDDDRLIRMVVREALEQSGLEVCEADSGAQALELFATARPDIVVLDVIMPGLDGFATCAKLRGSVGGGRVPILIMTGLDDAESIAHAYEQGATDFITKPLNPMILSYRVRYMLRGSHTLDALIKSEARLGLAQRIAKIGNWEWRPDTNQFTASAELCRLMGIRSQDFAGTFDAFIQLVHAEDRDRVNEALKRILSERVPCDIDHRLVLPNGADFTVNLQAEAVFDHQLKALSVVGTAQDISERKQSEQEIHRLAYLPHHVGDALSGPGSL